MIVGLLVGIGLFCAIIFMGAMLRNDNDSLGYKVLVNIVLVVVGLTFLGYGGIAGHVFAGIALTALALRWIAPFQEWAENHVSLLIVVGAGVFSTALLLSDHYSFSVKGIWFLFFNDSRFGTIPLSSIPICGWLLALGGAGNYIFLYFFFQMWRTKGEWLKKTSAQIKDAARTEP
jgi:hypothetical protein